MHSTVYSMYRMRFARHVLFVADPRFAVLGKPASGKFDRHTSNADYSHWFPAQDSQDLARDNVRG